MCSGFNVMLPSADGNPFRHVPERFRSSNLKALERRGQQALIAVRGRKSSRWPKGARAQRMHRMRDGCTTTATSGWATTELPDDQPIPGPSPQGLPRGVLADAEGGAGDGACEARAGGGRRHEDPGEHVAVQGDEPRADAGGGGSAERRDRADRGADGRAQRCGRARARGRRWRRWASCCAARRR